jgi:cytochrome P450 PksS
MSRNQPAVTMPSTNPNGLPELDFGDDYFRQPHRTLGALVDAGARAAWVPQMGTTMFLRHADVLAALGDHRLGAMGTRYYEQQGWSEGPYIDWIARTVVFLDAPDHDRLRSLLNRAFTPRQVANVKPITAKIAAELADAAADAGEVDLYSSFAQRLPLQVICEMLSVPSVDHEQLGAWTADLSLATAYPSEEGRLAVDRSMRAFEDYAADLIRERRRNPGDDLLSALIAVEEAGERLSLDELKAMIVQMLYAGHETTRNLIGNGLFTLLAHPEQLEQLRRDRSLLDRAVEEMLRYEPPIIFLSRIVLEDMKLGGVELLAGEMIHVALSSANRVADEFDEPDRFDITRKRNRQLSFGFGHHFCLGASVARMEGRVAFQTLLDRFREIERIGPKPAWATATALRTLESFPLRLTPA